MQLSYRLWLGASALVLVSAVTLAAYWIWNRTHREITITAPLDPACQLQQGPCRAVFPNGNRITLSIDPLPIEGSKSLYLEVKTEGMEVDTVEVDFRGLGMNMGYNRPRLEKKTDGIFSGTGVLSTCILKRMPWEAMVLATTGEGVMAAPFRFETVRR